MIYKDEKKKRKPLYSMRDTKNRIVRSLLTADSHVRKVKLEQRHFQHSNASVPYLVLCLKSQTKPVSGQLGVPLSGDGSDLGTPNSPIKLNHQEKEVKSFLITWKLLHQSVSMNWIGDEKVVKAPESFMAGKKCLFEVSEYVIEVCVEEDLVALRNPRSFI